MFDDIDKNKINLNQGNIPQGGLPPAQPSPQVPPAGRVEDIFRDTERVQSQTGTDFTKPDKPPIFQPKAPLPAERGVGDVLNAGSNMKQILILGGIVLAAAAVLAGGWYGYKFFSADKSIDSATEDKSGTEQENLDNKKEDTKNIPGNNQQATTDQTVTQPADSDRDGLSDEEESALGMNINNVDSDDDGLFDREEVRVYKTDPLKKDTDGDGYLDGEEVRKGYNPSGAGRLYKIE